MFTMFSGWRRLRRERAAATLEFRGGEGSEKVKGAEQPSEAAIVVKSSRRKKRAFQILFKFIPKDFKSFMVVLIRYRNYQLREF
jgi:hypothetical protein